jgi:hypothetical protein
VRRLAFPLVTLAVVAMTATAAARPAHEPARRYIVVLRSGVPARVAAGSACA